VTSKDAGERGRVILLAVMISGVDDRLVNGRSYRRRQSRWLTTGWVIRQL